MREGAKMNKLINKIQQGYEATEAEKKELREQSLKMMNEFLATYGKEKSA